MVRFHRFLRDESAAVSIEYSVIGSLISVLIISALLSIRANVSSKFDSVAQNLT